MLKFTRHAIKRLKERHIPVKTIKQILDNPSQITHLANNTFACYSKINNKNLVIIFEKQRENIKVITAYEN